MHRQPLLELLRRYADLYPAEADVAQRIERLVTMRADCFERSCRPGHITGSAWVLSHDRQRCLLVHHGKLDRWLQPGGHADGQCDVAEVARREAQEETGLTHLEFVGRNAAERSSGMAEVHTWLPEPRGLVSAYHLPLDLDIHLIPPRLDAEGREVEDAHEHHDIRFLLVAAAGQELAASAESHEVRWFTRDEVLEVTDEESVLRMLRKAGPR